MPKRSAGLMMYRRSAAGVEVLLVHPGGPHWVKKDLGAWTIPKGEYDPAQEDALDAARREFQEETGFVAGGEFLALGDVVQKSGKIVSAWAFEGDCDPSKLVSNTCEITWPPRSGKRLVVPEIDRGAWFDERESRVRLRLEQQAFLDGLLEHLRATRS
jgi:predicted NUDIX family NTP pyrophosphohydrolase